MLSTLAGLSAVFLGSYVLARRWDNYAIVDIVWSYAFAGLVLTYSLLGTGWLPRRALIAALVTVWSLRLGTHLLIRVRRHHPLEDGRYVQLRKEWGHSFPLKMGVFFQMQALSVVVLGVGFFVVSLNPVAAFRPWEIVGAILWLIAIVGESLADRQLSAFKNDPGNRDRVCDVGLWHYSRHPNYFFEWLIWLAYFVFALGSPWGWISVIAPAGILYLLLGVTGIPLAEEQSLRSKGDAYRRYQQTTSAFIPWLPREIP